MDNEDVTAAPAASLADELRLAVEGLRRLRGLLEADRTAHPATRSLCEEWVYRAQILCDRARRRVDEGD